MAEKSPSPASIASSLNPLKRVNSILTDKIHSYEKMRQYRLNPLKRVNSILTNFNFDKRIERVKESQSPQTGQFNSYRQA